MNDSYRKQEEEEEKEQTTHTRKQAHNLTMHK